MSLPIAFIASPIWSNLQWLLCYFIPCAPGLGFSPALCPRTQPPTRRVLSHSQYDLRENSKHSEVLIDLTEYCGQLVEAKCLTVNPQDNNCLAVGASGPFVRLYDIRMIHNHR